MYVVILYCFSEKLWITRCRIGMSGDVEVNPGPKCNSCHWNLNKACHWNLNSLIAHSFAKVSVLMANILVNKFDIVCLSETFLNSKILTDDESLQIFLVAVLLGLITLLIQNMVVYVFITKLHYF